MERFKEIAIDLAQASGQMLMGSLGRVKEVSHKGEIDLVTELDRRSEELIVGRLRRAFPHHAIIAEESGGEGGAEYLWLVDPLDGTTNYAHGLPWFTVSIGLLRGGKPILGVVYNPPLDELFWAERGKGAWLNGGKIEVSRTTQLSQSLLATGFPYDIRVSEVNNLDHFSHFSLQALAIRRAGSAALDLAYLACGRFDGFWELKLHPWDMAAGSLLIEEAGGDVTDFKGEGFDPFGKEILASNGRIHKQMLAVLNGEQFTGVRK